MIQSAFSQKDLIGVKIPICRTASTQKKCAAECSCAAPVSAAPNQITRGPTFPTHFILKKLT